MQPIIESRRRRRVLFLGCHLPFPPLSGGRRRELELIKRLRRSHDVHLLVASKTFREDRRNARRLEPFCERVEVFPTTALPPEPDREDLPLQVLRHRSPALTRRVQELLTRGEFDLVHVEGFYLMQHVPPRLDKPLLLVDQNVEYELWRQRARAGAESNGGGNSWRQYRATFRAELEAWRRADLLVALTGEDRKSIRTALPRADVRLVPDGADHLPARMPIDSPPRTQGCHDPLVVFCANFAYAPNVDAAIHLCEAIMPLVRTHVPGVRLRLVGNDPPDELRARESERVEVTGRVPEVLPHIDAADVIVCPLRIGGGMKVKAIEALQRGKALVTSSLGPQGLPVPVREAMMIADDPRSFGEAVASLLLDSDRRVRLERRAAAAASYLPSWDDAAAALADAYEDLFPRSSAAGRPAATQPSAAVGT